MFPRKLIYRKACGPTRSVQHLFVWVYRKRCLRFYLISLSANHGIRAVNFQRRELLEIARHVLSAQRVLSLMALDACALEPGRRFVTERGKKQRKPKFKPGPHCLGNDRAKPNVLYFCEPRQCASNENPFKVSCQDLANRKQVIFRMKTTFISTSWRTENCSCKGE